MICDDWIPNTFHPVRLEASCTEIRISLIKYLNWILRPGLRSRPYLRFLSTQYLEWIVYLETKLKVNVATLLTSGLVKLASFLTRRLLRSRPTRRPEVHGLENQILPQAVLRSALFPRRPLCFGELSARVEVTRCRWLDYFFDIWPSKFVQWHKNLPKYAQNFVKTKCTKLPDWNLAESCHTFCIPE